MQKFLTHPVILFALTLLACSGPADHQDGTRNERPELVRLRAAVVENHAELVHATYTDARIAAEEMRDDIAAFLAAPDAAGLTRARRAWIRARGPYGQSEVFRFGNGPIDDADGPEGLLNAWPMDEAYVDGVVGAPNAGIINAPEKYPVIEASLLEDLNEHGGETNVSTGYHAIEFLLWGQDLSEDGPGDRQWTDYTTAPNADRRGKYLITCAELVVRQLRMLEKEWEPGNESNYRNGFVADPRQAMAAILQGMGTLAKGELAGERLEVAMLTQDQEDEQSCFSDNTDMDIAMNMAGIANVYRGRYERLAGDHVRGPSPHDLIALVDPDLARTIENELALALQLCASIPSPFDKQVQQGDPGAYIGNTIPVLKGLGDRFSNAATVLGLTITTAVD